MLDKRNESTTDKILEVFRTLHRLKELPRQGFVYFGFKGDETDSIAEHSFMVAWIAYVIGEQLGLRGPDLAKVTLMALVHDWGEALTGDFGYSVKGRFPSLAKTERAAFTRLVEGLPPKDKTSSKDSGRSTTERRRERP